MTPPKPHAPQKPAQKTPPALQRLSPTSKRPRIVLNAVEGWGKTTAGAHADGAAILMADGETGYETLVQAGRVPSVPVATVSSWADLIGLIDAIQAEPGDVKNVVLDALGGFERMCHTHVCKRDFQGDWSERGFLGFHKGYEMSVNEWLILLARLDRLRTAHDIGIIMLSHSRIRPGRNPLGEDYDRYETEAHPKTWGVTAKWADAVLFGTFYTVTKRDGQRAKGIGGADRVLYTEHRDAFDAKNRFGLPPVIDIPNDPTTVWETIIGAINAGR